jgi:hypothetical protein
MTDKKRNDEGTTEVPCECATFMTDAIKGEDGCDCATMMSQMPAAMTDCDCMEMMKRHMKTESEG